MLKYELKRRSTIPRTTTTSASVGRRGLGGQLSFTCPPDDELVVGCFPGLSILAAKELGIDNPSALDPRFLSAARGSAVYLHAMHSAVDWFAYAIWTEGKLKRSLSLSPDSGVIEDIGPRLAFEEPYWDGQHPLGDPDEDEEDDYPFASTPWSWERPLCSSYSDTSWKGAPQVTCNPKPFPWRGSNDRQAVDGSSGRCGAGNSLSAPSTQ